MAVKYSCTKCGRRYVDWGAEKIKSGEGCSDCKGEFLELAGFDPSKAAAKKKKPALKRKRRAAPAAKPPASDNAGPEKDAKGKVGKAKGKAKGKASKTKA